MINPLSNPSYLLPPLIAASVTIVLLALVWQKAHKDTARRIFCCLLISMMLWSLLTFGMRSSSNPDGALLWERALIAPAFAVWLFFYHFTLVQTNTRGQRGILLIAYLLLLLIAALAPTDLLIERMHVQYYGYAPVTTIVSVLLFACGFALIVCGVYNLLRRYRLSALNEERNRILYLTTAAVFPILGAGLDGFSDLPPAAIWTNLIFCIICSIAILKYHLLDIRVVVRKSLVYLLVSIGIAIPYVSLLYFLHHIFKPAVGPWWIHALIILLLAIILRPLYSSAQQLVDRLFYRDRYDYLRALKQFSQEAQSIVNLKELSATMTRLVSGALHNSSICLLLPSEGEDGLVVVSSIGLESPPSGVVLKSNSPLVKWLGLHQDIISSELLNIVPQLQSLSLIEKNNLEQIGAKLLVPIKTRQGQLSGILLLGQKLSQQSYSNEDRQLLTTVSNHMAMALENALLYEQTRRAEEVLRESEEAFRQFFDNEPNYCYMISPDAIVLNVNKAALRVLGYEKEELVGKPLQTIYAPESILKMKQCFEKWERTGALKDEEFTITTKDGNRRTVLLSANVVKNSEGEVLYSVSVQKDTTERNRAEEARRESESRYRLLAENAEDVIWTVDMNMRPTYVSPSITSLLGYNIEEAMTKTMEKIFTRDSYELAMRVLEEELAIERLEEKDLSRSRTLELELNSKDGSVVPIESKFTFLREPEGRPVAILAIARDITERKRAEAEKKEMEQKAQLASRLATVGEMASGIAHEINNPLTGVIGFAELLMQQDTSEEIKRQLEVINDGAQRVSGILNRLLTFARQQKPKRTYVNINDIVATTLDLRAYTMKTGNIEVTSHLGPELPRTMADSGQLQQVFLNIILNAETEMKSAHGGGNLLAKTEMIDDSIRISFEDDGPGITKENMERIFDPFFTTREVGQGTGLGLSVCHGIIAAHGGKIYCKSELGKGATLIVELPVVVEDKQWERPQPSEDEPKILASARILVVDDEPSAQQFLAQLLTDAGHKVDVVGNANDALEKIMTERYSLILLDIKMPGMNGIELYTYLQKIYGALAERVIFVTGDIAGEETNEFLSKSSAPYIVKPFDATQLRKDINRILIERGM